ncbi:lipoprotein-releasing ABC transporter permease subunit [Denitrobaculum tricleocarpae]|uniref:Lipoprotein-releasing ABC transporter permease subunit n=1 Tax=Denitrobaculum tricleocarpae TaxID=2591009 RepID=A0A545TPG4_9PROT|nr:lipoprotein-releasing ABC transporter permease subunit [Denitrobaculum tricleocarpae]TQV79116.1 lipoprotein-releasing ABC transporter permease subunit [Denitrobaculum tricleocarpae]
MVFDAVERMVAMRYLRARRKEGFISVIAWISLIGIALGVATLIIVMAVMNGFRQELVSNILGVEGHVTVVGTTAPFDNYEELTERLRAIPGVESAAPQIQADVMLTAGGTATGGRIRGMSGEDLRARAQIADNIVRGSLENFGTDDGVAIGRGLAAKLRIRVGDRITLVSPNGTATVMGTVPRLKAYRVAAIFEVGNYLFDNSYMYVPLEAAQLFFRMQGRANAVELFIDNLDDLDQMTPAVRAEAGPGLRTLDWKNSYGSFFDVIQVERNVMFLILSLIVVVAALNIISGQIMLVKDKGRDIAILRTMGATRGMVLRIFFVTGASIGVVGTVAGFVLGLSFAENIDTIKGWVERVLDRQLFPQEFYFLSQLPAEVVASDVIQVVGMALVISFIAPLFPAWRAARMDPVEALRYE